MEVKFWPRYWNSQTKRIEVSNLVFPLFILTTDPCTSSIQYIFVRDHELFHKRDFRWYHYAVSTVKHTTRNPSPLNKKFCCRWTILKCEHSPDILLILLCWVNCLGQGFLTGCVASRSFESEFISTNATVHKVWYHQWDLVQPCLVSSAVCNAVYLLKCSWIDIFQTSL